MKRKLLQECLQIARDKMQNHPESECYLHYSFIVQYDKIVGMGVNRAGTPLVGYPKYGKLHAESDAWFQCKGILEKRDDFSVVNVRLSKAGELKISKPCVCCTRFLEKFGCKEVWFSTDVGFAKLVLE